MLATPNARLLAVSPNQVRSGAINCQIPHRLDPHQGPLPVSAAPWVRHKKGSFMTTSKTAQNAPPKEARTARIIGFEQGE